ncbi:MAG TPA: hypothetical protein VK137_00935, partial [Planctomycetaceae bacterium]|nr:hypothetical protein [Planctomycetaceae bacterium]
MNSLCTWLGCHQPPELFWKCQSWATFLGTTFFLSMSIGSPLMVKTPPLRSNLNDRRSAVSNSDREIGVKGRKVSG